MQILLSEQQRRRVTDEARTRGISAARVVRDALDAHLGAATSTDRVEALESIRSLHGQHLEPDEIDRIAESERASAADDILAPHSP